MVIATSAVLVYVPEGCFAATLSMAATFSTWLPSAFSVPFVAGVLMKELMFIVCVLLSDSVACRGSVMV